MNFNRATDYFFGQRVFLLWKFQHEFILATEAQRAQRKILIKNLCVLCVSVANYSSSSFTPCIRFVGQPARSQPFTNMSRSPSITP